MTGDQLAASSGPVQAGPAHELARLAIVLSGHDRAQRTYRVDSPDRLLRAWTMLRAADDELHQIDLRPEAAARLERQLDTVTAELRRSLSPALTDELRHLSGLTQPALTGEARDLRLKYASLLGWIGGLVVGMLSQLEVASSRTHGGEPGPRGDQPPPAR